MFRFPRPFKTALIALGLFCQVLALGFVSPAPAVSPTLREVLLLNGGCANGASVVINFAASTTCGTSFGALSVTRNTVAYEDDSSGNWTAFAANTLRRTDKGALIEESRTNSIRNNSMQGAAPGTQGTAPTNWGISASGNGLTRTIVGIGVENGIDYIDVQFSGTPSASTSLTIRFDGLAVIAATNAQVWTASTFVRLVAGSLTNLGTISNNLLGTDGATQTEATSTLFTPSAAWQRIITTRTLNNVSTTDVISQLAFAYTIGNAIDFTIRVSWPQLELGAFVTSPIRTTVAAVGRAADVVSIGNLPTFGSAFSMYDQFVATSAAISNTTYFLSESINNRFLYAVTATTQIRTYNGSAVLSSTPISYASRVKGAAGFDGTGRSIVGTGATLITDANVNPAPTVIGIGQSGTGSVFGSVYHESVALWPNTRLSNATLQSLVAP